MYGGEADTRDKSDNAVMVTGGSVFGVDASGRPGGIVNGGGGVRVGQILQRNIS